MEKKLNVAVFLGGNSSEREVSLKSGKKVAEAVERLGYEVRIYDPAKDLIKIIEDKEWIDVVFPVLHGKYGEDGTIQGFCELLGLSYVGSGVLASALTINKLKTIDIYKIENMPVAKSILADEKTDVDEVEKLIGFPCVIKPVSDGSSIGVEIVDDKSKFLLAFEKVKEFKDQVMIEEYIKGRELTVGVIGNDDLTALPVIEIKPKTKFFDYEAKYNGETEEKIANNIDQKIIERVQDYATRAHRALGCRGLSRTDFILNDDKIVLLETNTMPGLTDQSLLPKAAAADGISFDQLIDRLLNLALEEKDGDS